MVGVVVTVDIIGMDEDVAVDCVVKLIDIICMVEDVVAVDMIDTVEVEDNVAVECVVMLVDIVGMVEGPTASKQRFLLPIKFLCIP